MTSIVDPFGACYGNTVYGVLLGDLRGGHNFIN